MKNLAIVVAAVAVGLVPCMASATLGQPEASVQSDGQQLKGTIKSMAYTGYRVHEIQLPSGTLLREYVGSDGNVFAVAWNGPALPDLSQSLGQYFTTYVNQAKAQPAARGHFQVRQADFVAHSGGRMRHFTGRAYLPAAVPSGVSLEDLH